MSEMRWAADLAALGPFFAVDIHPADARPTGSWQSMDVLLTDPAALQSRIDRVRAALAQRAGRVTADIDIRVAVSVTHLGLVARLISPMLAAAALGRNLSREVETLWWKDELGGPYSLSVAPGSTQESVAERGAPIGAAPSVTQACIDRYPVSARVLWGNIGSATNSAAQMISRARPDLTERTRELADAVLHNHRIDDGLLRSGPQFQRRSCCLIYRIGPGKGRGHDNYCGDCVLRT